MKTIIRSNRGMSLLIVMVMMTILLSMTAAALLISGIDTKTTSNLQTGTAALQVADAGVQHAVALLPLGTDFNALLTGYVSGFPCMPAPPCNGSTSKPTLIQTLGNYTYTVVVDNDTNVSGETATTDNNQIVNLTATATGPNSSVRKIAVTVARSGAFIPPAAMYIPDNSDTKGKADVKINFDDNFTITGKDYNADGTLGSGAPVPGIGLTDSKTTQDTTKELKGKKASEVSGAGGSPSVVTVADKIDVKQLIQDILSSGIPNQTLQTVKDGSYKNATWGTYANPMITQITGDADLKGSISGYGVLIVQGDLKIHDVFDFNGLVIVDNNFEISPDKKTGANITGAVIANGDGDSKSKIKVGANAQIYYSSSVLTKLGIQYGTALPTPAQLRGWREMMQ